MEIDAGDDYQHDRLYYLHRGLIRGLLNKDDEAMEEATIGQQVDGGADEDAQVGNNIGQHVDEPHIEAVEATDEPHIEAVEATIEHYIHFGERVPQTPPRADLVELQAQNQKLTEKYDAVLMHTAVLQQQIRKLTSANKKLSEDSKSSALAAINLRHKSEQLTKDNNELKVKVNELKDENKLLKDDNMDLTWAHQQIGAVMGHEVKGVASSSGQQGKRKLEPKPPALPPPLSLFQPWLVAKNAKANGKSEGKGKCNVPKGEGKGKSKGEGTRVAKRLPIGMSSGEGTIVAKRLPIGMGSSGNHKKHKGK